MRENIGHVTKEVVICCILVGLNRYTLPNTQSRNDSFSLWCYSIGLFSKISPFYHNIVVTSDRNAPAQYRIIVSEPTSWYLQLKSLWNSWWCLNLSLSIQIWLFETRYSFIATCGCLKNGADSIFDVDDW